MAERRMFTDKITDSDAFLDMPASTQCLYFHLNMKADDDGFVNNPKKITRTLNSSEDDLKLLLMKRFILAFESGVIVIKHWRMHNYIRKDRYNSTVYQEELARLDIKDNGSYTIKEDDVNQRSTNSQPNDIQRLPQVRLGKVSIGKDNKDKECNVFESYASGNTELMNALNDYTKMRSLIKSPMSDKSKKIFCTTLDRLVKAGNDPVELIEQSILNNWKSVFPLRKDFYNGKNKLPDQSGFSDKFKDERF